MKDYHYILGVGKNASQEKIKKAYQRLSKKFHPDLHPGDVFFEQRFKDINEAYEALVYQESATYSAPHSATSPRVQFMTSRIKADTSEPVVIKWETTNATKVHISIFGEVPLSGQKKIVFKQAGLVTLELKAENEEGELVESVIRLQISEKKEVKPSSWRPFFTLLLTIAVTASWLLSSNNKRSNANQIDFTERPTGALSTAKQNDAGGCLYTDLSEQFDFNLIHHVADSGPNKETAILLILSKEPGKSSQMLTEAHVPYIWDAVQDCSKVLSYATGVNVAESWVGVDNDYGALVVADLNFDGLDDLAIPYGTEAKGLLYRYYTQSLTGAFVKDEYLNNHLSHFPNEVKPNENTIIYSWHDRAGDAYYNDVYVLNRLNQEWSKNTSCIKGCD